MNPQEHISRAPLADASAVQVELGEPVVVAQSAPTETRWGRYQFPMLSRLPDGKLLLTFANAPDAYEAHGQPQPAYTSADHGKTWAPFTGEAGITAGVLISPVFNGEYLTLPKAKGLKVDAARMPKVAGHYNAYNGFEAYRLGNCPPEVQAYIKDVKSLRWTPGTGRWKEEPVKWDDRNQLVYTYEGWAGKTSQEDQMVRLNGELFLIEYRTLYATMDGRIPQGWLVSLMVSTDNGHSFQRRSAIDSQYPQDNLAEPALVANSRKELVCVIRRSFQEQTPMYVTHSADSGKTWEKPLLLHPVGVFPHMLLLENGVLVLAFGRPGVYLSFSPDGTGRSWTPPTTLIDGKLDNPGATTCGYTTLEPIGPNTFLLAYSDFRHKNVKGEACKTILVRPVTVRRR